MLNILCEFGVLSYHHLTNVSLCLFRAQFLALILSKKSDEISMEIPLTSNRDNYSSMEHPRTSTENPKDANKRVVSFKYILRFPQKNLYRTMGIDFKIHGLTHTLTH